MKKMKRLSYISFALFGLMAAVSCVEEDLNACPPEGGGVTVALRVEKFQTRPPYGPSDLEESFGKRIHSLDYLLYADGRLLEQGSLEDVGSTAGDSYLFRHNPLPFGTYRLAFVANTSASMMTGSTDAPESRFIVYQGENAGDDHLRADLPFEVTCPCSNEFETVLQRVHGVTRFRFENVPADVTAIEVSLDNVGERIPLSGEPDRPCEVIKRVGTADMTSKAAGLFTLGTFSTLPGTKSSWRLKLYAENDAVPVYEHLVTDTLRIERNQLLELKVRFKDTDFNGEVEFSVDIDTTWDGSNEGGGETT